MATLQGNYTNDEWMRIINSKVWTQIFTVKYTNVHDTTHSRHIRAYQTNSREWFGIPCHEVCYEMIIFHQTTITWWHVPFNTSLSESLKSIGFVFQFCEEFGTGQVCVVPKDSIVSCINYEDAQKLAIDTLYKSIKQREEEIVLKENYLNKREEEEREIEKEIEREIERDREIEIERQEEKRRKERPISQPPPPNRRMGRPFGCVYSG